MHPTLRRQFKKVFGEKIRVPKDLAPFLALVSATYEGFDEDRQLLERSLDISSEELSQINAQLRKEKESIEEEIKTKTRTLEKKLKALEKYEMLTTNREMKMIELKREVNELLVNAKKKKRYNVR